MSKQRIVRELNADEKSKLGQEIWKVFQTDYGYDSDCPVREEFACEGCPLTVVCDMVTDIECDMRNEPTGGADNV